MRLLQEMDLTIEDVDALTGTPVGWPIIGDFPHIDLVGLDILKPCSRKNGPQMCATSASELRIPDFCSKMIERKWLGDKTKRLLPKVQRRGRQGRTPRSRLKTLEYHPGTSLSSPPSRWQRTSRHRSRVAACCWVRRQWPHKGDKAGAFLMGRSADL